MVTCALVLFTRRKDLAVILMTVDWCKILPELVISVLANACRKKISVPWSFSSRSKRPAAAKDLRNGPI